MQRFSVFATASGTGVFCAITATNYVSTPAASGVVQFPQAQLISSTLYCTANAGLTSATVVPVFLGPDGNYYPLQVASAPTAAGFVFAFQLTTPVPGIGIQVTAAPVGGTLYLTASAAQL